MSKQIFSETIFLIFDYHTFVGMRNVFVCEGWGGARNDGIFHRCNTLLKDILEAISWQKSYQVRELGNSNSGGRK